MTFRYSLSQKSIRIILLLGILFLAVALGFLLGKSTSTQHQGSSPESSSYLVSEQLLNLSVIPSVQPSTQVISSENINDNFEYDIRYINITDVTVESNGIVQDLEIALQTGIISEEEILFLARTDAKNGFCTLESESEHGLTHFTFSYPDYNLRIIYDIFEAPDGQQHLISDLCLYLPEYNLGPYTDLIDQKTGVRLDFEDWGLNFEISDVTSRGLKLNCTQSKGQQIGTLVLDGFSLRQDNQYIPRLNGSAELSDLDITLLSNSCTEVTIDWTEDYGELPAGEYRLILDIRDIFDETQVHPLMEDFHDWQIYALTFIIPEQ